jgi:hypothetical protein
VRQGVAAAAALQIHFCTWVIQIGRISAILDDCLLF